MFSRRDPSAVIVDLAAITFLDAAGIGALVGLRADLASHSAAMTICHPTRPVQRAFTAAGLQQLLTITANDPSISPALPDERNVDA